MKSFCSGYFSERTLKITSKGSHTFLGHLKGCHKIEVKKVCTPAKVSFAMSNGKQQMFPYHCLFRKTSISFVFFSKKNWYLYYFYKFRLHINDSTYWCPCQNNVFILLISRKLKQKCQSSQLCLVIPSNLLSCS